MGFSKIFQNSFSKFSVYCPGLDKIVFLKCASFEKFSFVAKIWNYLEKFCPLNWNFVSKFCEENFFCYVLIKKLNQGPNKFKFQFLGARFRHSEVSWVLEMVSGYEKFGRMNRTKGRLLVCLDHPTEFPVSYMIQLLAAGRQMWFRISVFLPVIISCQIEYAYE